MKQYIFGILCLCASSLYAQTPPQAAIASANQYATNAGMDVLKQGGNAFDAAIAVASMLAVTEPYYSGIGGGGFWLIYNAKEKKYLFIDAREQAPAKATSTMYDAHPNTSENGPLAAAIPGEVAGMIYLSQHYANLTLAQDMRAAYQLAAEGFPVTPYYQGRVQFRLKVLQSNSQASQIFLENNHVPKLGYVIKQPELAQTIQKIIDTQGQDFYQGGIAKTMVKAVDAAGGIWQLSDLKNYRVKVRAPLTSQYKQYQIITAPPPSAGGIALITMLNILSNVNYFDMSKLQQTHYMIEMMRNVFFDRYQYLGDPDFTKVPMDTLLSQQHAKQILKRIQPDKATASIQLSEAIPATVEGMHTTHYSIIDKQGNMVAATLSLNYPFGSTFVAGSSGVLLNDEMDDFAKGINKQNVYGLLGSKPNLIKPGKRPLSSMTPTFLISPERTVIYGTPGGSRIVTMMMLATVAAIEDNSAEQIVSLSRYHMQFYPDQVQIEPKTLTASEQKALQKMGYKLKVQNELHGNMQVVIWDKQNNKITAASDPRGEGKAEVSP